MLRWLVIMSTMFISTVMAAQAAELVLVENGVSRAPIIVFEGAPFYTRRAADDLADYLEKVSGTRPPVLEGRPEPLPEHAIWVGFQPALAELFPGLDLDFKNPEEILVAANDQHLVIAGRDRWDPDNPTVPGAAFQYGTRDVGGFQSEYGTANAVYTFLQDYLDIRWFWPGEEDVPKRDTIAFAPFEYRYHPQIRMRHTMFSTLRPYRPGGGPGNPSSDWARFNRVQLDSLYAPVGGHGFGDWWARYHETHPEYFALQPDGTRSGYPGPGTVKVCEANPAVWAQWLADVEELVTQYPSRTVFSAAANDSWASGHCICADCRAWDRLDAEPRRFAWQGLTQEYVALSDRQVTFANQLGRLLRERFPDREYYVAILAYGHSRPAPLGAVPDDNVIVSNVASFFHDLPVASGYFDPASSENHKQYFLAWAKITKNHIWRPNVGNPAGWMQGGPADLGRAGENFRLLADTGCLGIYIDNVWMYWATQGPLYYLMAQLAWDPSKDGRAVLDDWCRRGFGPAAEAVKAYWALLEEACREMASGKKTWGEAFSKNTLTHARELLDAARAALTGAPDPYARRLAFARAGLDFLRLQTENRALVPKLRETGAEDAEALARARANWAGIQELTRRHPRLWSNSYGPQKLAPVINPDFTVK